MGSAALTFCVFASASSKRRLRIGCQRKPSGEADERVDVPDPVPVYITYFTVAPGGDGTGAGGEAVMDVDTVSARVRALRSRRFTLNPVSVRIPAVHARSEDIGKESLCGSP